MKKNELETYFYLLTRLWSHLNSRRRNQFQRILALMVISSLAEIFSIGVVAPFLAALTDPQKVFSHPSSQFWVQFFGVTTPDQFLLFITIIFGLSSIIAGCLRMLLLWAGIHLSFGAGADISLNIYRRTLYQPYTTHLSRNSSEIINGISRKVGIVINSMSLILTFISSSVILIVIVFTLILIDPIPALLMLCGFGFIYATIIYLTRKKQLAYSQVIAKESTQVIKTLQEGLGGIRDILIDGSQEVYCRLYSASDLPLRNAEGKSQFISSFPRYAIEPLGMMLIAISAYFLSRGQSGVSGAIPILGTLALGAQRLVPILQQAYQSYSIIRSTQVSFEDAVNLLDQPLPEFLNYPAINTHLFDWQICFDRVWFSYDHKQPWTLQDINLRIVKGSRVGFIGSTGSGKSTLLDIMMGLLEATKGALVVDGDVITPLNARSWQSRIAHVPQSIFLSDGTIKENIAFGVPKNQINSDRVREVARQAQIAEVIEKLENQYETLVGERGVRLSGGQRQRIGIARALYKNADVLIFDEATSALDNKTEQAVMDAIEGLSKNLTILIIAHRISTLKNCNQIVELESGRIKRVCSYAELSNEKS